MQPDQPEQPAPEPVPEPEPEPYYDDIIYVDHGIVLFTQSELDEADRIRHGE